MPTAGVPADGAHRAASSTTSTCSASTTCSTSNACGLQRRRRMGSSSGTYATLSTAPTPGRKGFRIRVPARLFHETFRSRSNRLREIGKPSDRVGTMPPPAQRRDRRRRASRRCRGREATRIGHHPHGGPADEPILRPRPSGAIGKCHAVGGDSGDGDHSWAHRSTVQQVPRRRLAIPPRSPRPRAQSPARPGW